MISTGGSFFSGWRCPAFLTAILPKSAERRKPPFEPTHVENETSKLANRALDGLQRLLEQRFSNTCRRRAECKVHLVRYADDFIITGTSQVLLKDEVRPLVEHFLRERGLELSHEKTRITHIKTASIFSVKRLDVIAMARS